MLNAVESEIAQFVKAIFCHSDEGTAVGLRSFTHDKDDRKARVQGFPLIMGDLSGVIHAATKAATDSANSDVPLVFCPPLATFMPTGRAREVDLANGVCISVELDAGDTTALRHKLEHLLGPVTMAVASGGEWTDPDTGQIHPKLHCHWRLSEVTRDSEGHQRLKHARDLAMVFVGADPSAVPLVHPLRWPGSWHRKGKPVLAMIQVGNPAAEVHLEDVLARLEEAVEASGLREAGVADAPRVPGVPQAPIGRLRPAVLAIPNTITTDWHAWNNMGLLIHRGTGGSDDGLALWIDWSMPSSRYLAGECQLRWLHFHDHGYDRAGAGTLFHIAKSHGWVEVRPDNDAPLSSDDWQSMQRRAAGETIPATPEARASAKPAEPAKALIWTITEGWDEAAIPPRPWIAKGYLMRGAVTVVSGPGSAGKSSLMVAWSTALAVGCSFGRFKVQGTARVASYNVEDDAEEQKRRYSAMLGKLCLGHDALGGRLAIIGPEHVGTLLHQGRNGGMLLNTPVMDKLMAFVDIHQPDVLMLDPFVELHGAEENDNTAIRAVMAAFRHIASARQMAVVLLHHARKGVGTPGDPDSLRGASSIVGAARVALTLTVMTEDEAKSFNVKPDVRRDYFRLDGAKSNYAPIGEAEWFERQERRINNGDGVAVVWPWTPPNLLKQTPVADLNAVLDRIQKGYADKVPYAATRRGNGSGRWVGHLVAQMLQGTDEQAKEIVNRWMQEGLLYEVTFRDPISREQAKGVHVDMDKRPGAVF